MTLSELQQIYSAPFFDLMESARAIFSAHWNKREVQLCTLLSIKTGGCSEDCAYCAQSARYQTGVQPERLINPERVLEVARRARESGQSRELGEIVNKDNCKMRIFINPPAALRVQE